MEWVLQLVDEIDDAIGVARHGWMGVSAQISMLFAALGGLLAAARSTLGMRVPRRART